jgi:acylphosphatase
MALAEGPVRAHLIVHGIVQGVSFRESTRREAARLGVDGWVRNRPDGTVEVAVQGPRPEVERLIAFCQHGPRLAQVDRVETRWEPGVPGESSRGFTIR